jgi:hypothetical protein
MSLAHLACKAVPPAHAIREYEESRKVRGSHVRGSARRTASRRHGTSPGSGCSSFAVASGTERRSSPVGGSITAVRHNLTSMTTDGATGRTGGCCRGAPTASSSPAATGASTSWSCLASISYSCDQATARSRNATPSRACSARSSPVSSTERPVTDTGRSSAPLFSERRVPRVLAI